MHLFPQYPSPSPTAYGPYASPPSMSTSTSIQGLPLEVTVVGCNKLKDTEWISRQDPYVRLEYASSKFRTRTCTDGHKTPVFQEKFVIPLIEGLREINVTVWNSNTLSGDDFIGSGRIQLQKVLSQGYDDSIWSLQSKRGRYSGEVRLIMHFQGANRTNAMHVPPTAMPAATSAPAYVPAYTTPMPQAAAPYNAPAYSSVPSQPPYAPTYPAQPTPPSYATNAYPHPPQPSAYPPQSYPPSTYPPSTYPPSTYPPATYPPSTYPSTYPPPPQASTYPPGPFPGLYPPPSY